MSITDDLRPVQIGHILFLDIVAFSTTPLATQRRVLNQLTAVVTGAPTFIAAQERGALIPLPTGDGMVLVFFDDVAAPARCAVEITRQLRAADTPVPVRIGIHSGLVQPLLDVKGHENLVGEGINTARRVMDCADDGHILLSGDHARWLREVEEWTGSLFDIGTATVKHGLQVDLYSLRGPDYGRADPPTLPGPEVAPATAATSVVTTSSESRRVVIVYKRGVHPDESVLHCLERQLQAQGHQVFYDRKLQIGMEWAKEIERRIRDAYALIPIISPRALRSEMLQQELEIALEERRHRGGPLILPIQVGEPEGDTDDDQALHSLISAFQYFPWRSEADNPRLTTEILSALREPITTREVPLEMVGGGMDPDSPFYVERSGDTELRGLLERRTSIVLVRGGRQIGKTSLLARGMKFTRGRGWRQTRTDFQKISSESLANPSTFYRQIAISLARQCKFVYDFATYWDAESAPNQNLEFFLRDLLDAEETPLVWFMDEADKLFSAPFASDFFALVRSWHNDRSAEPDGPMRKLTMVIAYATEAHLFIRDLNQSPFNVGERVTLEDFSVEQMLQLNERYGTPVQTRADMERLGELLHGHPYLTRRALDVLAREQYGFDALMGDAIRDDGPFGDHLQRVLLGVSTLEFVQEFIQNVLQGTARLSHNPDGFYRLQAAGLVRQLGDGRIVFRCSLYHDYLATHL